MDVRDLIWPWESLLTLPKGMELVRCCTRVCVSVLKLSSYSYGFLKAVEP